MLGYSLLHFSLLILNIIVQRGNKKEAIEIDKFEGHKNNMCLYLSEDIDEFHVKLIFIHIWCFINSLARELFDGK